MEKPGDIPSASGVYLFRDNLRKVIYVGKAKSLKNRIQQYFNPHLSDSKTLAMRQKAATVDYIETQNEIEALLLESDLIKTYKPYYNIQLKDDKRYPLLKLTLSEKWPRLILVRKKQPGKDIYFGPFPAKTTRTILKLAQRIFPLRKCSSAKFKNRKFPCLEFHLHYCLGPCVSKITRKEYLKICQSLKLFLKGRYLEVKKNLLSQMLEAGEKKDFERAAQLRDRLRALEDFFQKPSLKRPQNNLSGQSLEALQEALSLPQKPWRIEGYDISHIQGAEIVGVMVAFEGGKPLKKDYRKFNIHRVSGQSDDCLSMQEVIERRFLGTQKDLPHPQLLLIDGGKGQLQAAHKALKKAGLEIEAAALAKKNEELFVNRQNAPIILPREHAGLKLLQRVRDEAHRFAIGFHRARRKKSLWKEA